MFDKDFSMSPKCFTIARSSFRLPAPAQGREHVGEVPPNFRSQLVHELSILTI